MPEANRSVIALRHWAELSRMARAHRRPVTISWEHAERLIDACKTVWRAQSEELRQLLEKSNSRFAPLVDPLLIDFDLRRWLVEQIRYSVSCSSKPCRSLNPRLGSPTMIVSELASTSYIGALITRDRCESDESGSG